MAWEGGEVYGTVVTLHWYRNRKCKTTKIEGHFWPMMKNKTNLPDCTDYDLADGYIFLDWGFDLIPGVRGDATVPPDRAELIMNTFQDYISGNIK